MAKSKITSRKAQRQEKDEEKVSEEPEEPNTMELPVYISVLSCIWMTLEVHNNK